MRVAAGVSADSGHAPICSLSMIFSYGHRGNQAGHPASDAAVTHVTGSAGTVTAMADPWNYAGPVTQLGSGPGW